MANAHSTFWSTVAHKYDQVVDLQIGANTRALVRDRVTKEGLLGCLVEFGCGTGFYTQMLAEKATRVVATDLALGMLTLAKENITAANVTFQVEDCQQTSL